MARLLIKSEGFESRTLELRLGVNRLGRASFNDFQVEHPSISSTHCEIELLDGEVRICDCNSTNGTFVAGEPIKEAHLTAGQCFSVGVVEIEVENTEVEVAIPKFDGPPRPAPPVVRVDGSMICPRHPHAPVTHQCDFCQEVLCDACVSRLRRRGGKTLLLCGLCSHHVHPIGKGKAKKKSFMEILQKTVKLPFVRSRRDGD